MKNDIADILFKYTTGEATLEETNDALKEAEAGFNLEPGRNEITPDEMALTTVGDTPEEANGFGLLDTGTGSMEKVHVTNGKLDFGTWEGRAWAAIPRAGIDAWSAQLHDHAPGGGESLSAMLARRRS